MTLSAWKRGTTVYRYGLRERGASSLATLVFQTMFLIDHFPHGIFFRVVMFAITVWFSQIKPPIYPRSLSGKKDRLCASGYRRNPAPGKLMACRFDETLCI